MNKSNVFALCASGMALLFAGVIIGMAVEKNTHPLSAVVQAGQDREAARLEAEAKLAEETARRSAVEEANAREISRIMWENFDRLIELCSHEKLYDVEKQECQKLHEQLRTYFGDTIRMEYDSVTGKVKGIIMPNSTPVDLSRAIAMEKSKLAKLHEKAVKDARDATEKRMKSLEYSAKR